MIETRKAVAYVCNGIQFVRLVEHEWQDTTSIGNATDLGGRSQGPDALGGMTLESLADYFSNAIDERQEPLEVLDISGARARKAHTEGLCLARTSFNQLSLTNTTTAVGGDVELGLNITAPQKRYYTKIFYTKSLLHEKGSQCLLHEN